MREALPALPLTVPDTVGEAVSSGNLCACLGERGSPFKTQGREIGGAGCKLGFAGSS